jgi:carbamoyl-phosphate synthase large subunit
VGSAPARAVINSLKSSKYVIGIDIQDYCAGKYLCDEYVKCPSIRSDTYFEFIEQLITEKNIKYIYVIHDVELLTWANKKYYLETKFGIHIFVNDIEFIKITTDKFEMNTFCINNSIKIPKIFDDHNEITYPAIIKSRSGSGSIGTYILNSPDDFEIYKTIHKIDELDKSKYFIQEFIKGKEYTCDVLSNTNGQVLSVVPKERIEIRGGAAFKSLTVNNKDVIQFVTNVAQKINNKYSVNIQVIENKNDIYFIELNAKWATSLPLTVESGVNMPLLLINISNNEIVDSLHFKENILMIRHFTEYYEQL